MSGEVTGRNALAAIQDAAAVPVSARVLLTPLMSEKRPTLMQKRADGQETPRRESKSDAEPALGLGTTDQTVPFHDSIRVLLAEPRPLPVLPTATQSRAETQETPARALGVDSEPGLGLGTIDQAVPFHDSTRVLLTVWAFPKLPTAAQ